MMDSLSLSLSLSLSCAFSHVSAARQLSAEYLSPPPSLGV
ncbi:unnamed protein product [Spirodela intermedia]|uniref:Uncharacterized protein n=1 Tax=Spirodela intermedia TaxID=51605 RepID=A0A7I8JSZ7_SPIIN|nr:unnamed protein product [Spirodela intermedia]CAA6673296.1 unnamed protein product [Spirodela intermedia]